MINKFTHDIGKVLDSFIGNYDNFLIVRDLNSETGESSMHDFCNSYNLHSLCHKSTCYKNPEKHSCIDLFLTNSPKSFQNTQTIETGLSDFHKLAVTILKMYLPNNQAKVITYRDYKNFDISPFSEELLYEIKKLGPLNKNISIFHNTCIAVLVKYAPEKRKYIRANQANFMYSKLNHAIMLRSKLRNKFLKSRSNKDREAYKKQRNLCVSLLRQNKKDYFETLDMKSVTIKSSSSKKLLGVIIDNKLTFNEHVSKLCKKASNKLHALAQISKYMTKDKLRTVMNAFFTSQFAYCPLIWIFHNRTLNNRINKLQERALRLVHNDNTSSFYELLQKDNSFTIHHRNIQKLALEMYRVKHRIAPKIICELFNEANVPYNLRQDVSFRSYNVKTVLYGTETLPYLEPKIWNLVPSNIRDCATEPIFRKKIKKWKPGRCPCRLCKVFISNLGFID